MPRYRRGLGIEFLALLLFQRMKPTPRTNRIYVTVHTPRSIGQIGSASEI